MTKKQERDTVIVSLAKIGKTNAEIEKVVGVSVSTIKRVLKEAGVVREGGLKMNQGGSNCTGVQNDIKTVNVISETASIDTASIAFMDALDEKYVYKVHYTNKNYVGDKNYEDMELVGIIKGNTPKEFMDHLYSIKPEYRNRIKLNDVLRTLNEEDDSDVITLVSNISMDDIEAYMNYKDELLVFEPQQAKADKKAKQNTNERIKELEDRVNKQQELIDRLISFVGYQDGGSY